MGHRCPDCWGHGQISGNNTLGAADFCHTCAGSGRVIITPDPMAVAARTWVAALMEDRRRADQA